MPNATANGIQIEYLDEGDARAPVILLIMGWGMQLIAWPDAFCAGLVASGFRVIRFDNRDTGLSTKIASGPIEMAQVFARAVAGKPIEAPYTLRDMAKDAIGLLDALRIARAHIVGASMGGMIGQIVAAEYPTRTTSLVSIMSTSGNPNLPTPKAEIIQAVLKPALSGGDREAAIQYSMKMFRLIGSPKYPASDAELRANAERAIDRGTYAPGIARQFVAVLASGSRVELLPRIRVPTLVLHGTDDPLVPLAAGNETASLIPGARLQTIAGMGHDLPTVLLPRLVEAIATHCREAELRR